MSSSFPARASTERTFGKRSQPSSSSFLVSCGVAPSDDHVASARAVYDASAEWYVAAVGTELGAATEGPIDEAVLAAFVRMVPTRPGACVADLGCGPGRVAAFLASRGLRAIGVDVSQAMLARARCAHSNIPFARGQLDELPIATGALAGATCWYSIIHTPPERLADTLEELHRVLEPGGHLLLAFQANGGEAVHRPDAHGTGLPFTSYRHALDDVTRRLDEANFDVHATAQRQPEFDHETTPQAFVIAIRR